jgi:asparagine synthase (glutamine-hydrolysing)
MCGILGIFQFGGAEVDPVELRRLNGGMVHRGPDDEGYFVDRGIGLAMRRLSILDLGHGKQPMVSANGNFVIVFNGECYNFRRLRAELEAFGYSFKTDSDTEVVVTGFEHWGAAVLDRMIGMWGLAIYDRNRRELFLARDRLGKKQLYYRNDGKRFAFGSEMALPMSATDARALRLPALPEFLTYGYVGGPDTAIAGVRLLPEGHWAKVTAAGDLEIVPYWKLADIPLRGNVDERTAADQAYELIVDAVRHRLVSDVPVSVMLSSGLDSSTIAYVLARELGAPLCAFSVGYTDSQFDESRDAGRFASAMGMPWKQSIVSGSDVARDFPKIVSHGSSLQSNTAQIVYFYVNRMIHDAGFKVALNGSGGDELFAGYTTYRAATLFKAYRHVPAAGRRLLHGMAGLLPPTFARVSFEYMLKKFAACPYDSTLKAHGYWRTMFSEPELNGLLAPIATREGCYTRLYDDAFRELGVRDGSINSLLKADLKAWLTPMLPWVDNISMAHSVELRLPFLDHRLVEFALSLPAGALFRGWRLKRVMKRFLAPKLPASVRYRRKRGTHLPLGRWLNSELDELKRHYLSPTVLNRLGLFNMNAVDRWMREHQEKRADHTFKLWNLMVFSAWVERFGVTV